MKKLFAIWAVMLSVLFAVGCTENPTTDEPTQPVISIDKVEVTADSFTFEVTTNVPGVLGYTVVAEGFSTPKMNEWFAANSKEIAEKKTITISNLNDNTNYTLYAILRASKDNNLSAPKNWKFTTPDDGVENPITIDNVGYDNATFTINLPGNIMFQCIDKAFLTHKDLTPEDYIATEGIGIVTNGPLTVEWVNGGQYGPFEMRMRAGSEYYVIAAQCDDTLPYPNIIGEIYIKSFSTLHKPTTTAVVTTEITNVDSTSVTIKTTPDSDVATYYVYVESASQLHMIMDDQGIDIFLSTVLKQVVNYGLGWTLTAANEATWEGLTPNFNYSIALIVEDKKGAMNASLIDFTTGDKSMAPPTIDLSISEVAENPHSNLVLNIYSENAASGKVVFRPTADVNVRRYDNSDETIVNKWGTPLNAEQIEAIKTTGLSLIMSDLWPEVEYTALVLLYNKEEVSTLEATTYTTPAQAAAPRVESDLFTSLLGEWTMTYTLIHEDDVEATVVEATVSEVVTIAQGVDSKTETDYRDQNRLVILGFPFEVNAQGGYSKIPVYTPAQLLEMLPNYYAKGKNLVYRDYGPKIFLQIGEGDTITVPTSRGEYLYNWAEAGFLNFFGCDYNNLFTAPATFPVTLSADGNTLTIGAHQAGEEFGSGIYRPAVFLNEQELKACATSDIVLTRK